MKTLTDFRKTVETGVILACKRTFTEIQTKYWHLSRGLPGGMVTGHIEPCISSLLLRRFVFLIVEASAKRV